jgi:diguanylate cyclase (GGDEF)-like protein/PAS domain S-box-containing protein
LVSDIQISAANQLLEALQKSENQMRRRINLLVEIVFELNNQGEIVFSNVAWQKVLGYKVVNGTKLSNYIHEFDFGVLSNALSDISIDQPSISNILIRFKHQDGHLLTMSANFVLMESGVIGALHDVTKQIQIQNELTTLAHYDPLTKLPNRVLLEDRLEQAIINARRHNLLVAVLFLDLDDFKAINDQYGHQTGDEVLKEFGNLIRGALRETDSIARFGGDEFILLLTELESRVHCEMVVHRIYEALQQTITIDEIKIDLKGSIGIALYPEDQVDAEQLIRHADQAMYSAKQAGKNQIRYFDTSSNSDIILKNALVDQIKDALSKNQFLFHYQPKIDLHSGQIFGVEALIRWQHPEKGLITPGLFLPMIEGHPLSSEVGKWAIQSAVKQISQWNELGFHGQTSVNIGGPQMHDPNFYEFVVDTLKAFPSVKPSQLQLEVLETSAIADVDFISTLMNRFNEIGISFALDDFGTGYSSLLHLRSLPIHTLKIDQSFILNMLHSKEDLSIVQSVIALSKTFNCKVLAEGAETLEAVQALQSLGCDAAQGYYYSPAVPPTELYKLTTSNFSSQTHDLFAN